MYRRTGEDFFCNHSTRLATLGCHLLVVSILLILLNLTENESLKVHFVIILLARTRGQLWNTSSPLGASTLASRVARFFLDPRYQNRGKYTEVPQNIPNGIQMYYMEVKNTKCQLSIPTSSMARPSKIYPSWYFFV
jgi:hypothetical protein